MTENKNVGTMLKNGDKALSGMPYLQIFDIMDR